MKNYRCALCNRYISTEHRVIFLYCRLLQYHSQSRVVVPATLDYLCQRPFYKILVKVRNSKQNVLKIVLIIVNINKDENKSLISNQFSLKNAPLPPHTHFLENYFAEVKIKKLKTITNHF
jgi:DNA-directed RNA polymerase subunit RPC12/RpoP